MDLNHHRASEVPKPYDTTKDQGRKTTYQGFHYITSYRITRYSPTAAVEDLLHGRNADIEPFLNLGGIASKVIQRMATFQARVCWFFWSIHPRLPRAEPVTLGSLIFSFRTFLVVR